MKTLRATEEQISPYRPFSKPTKFDGVYRKGTLHSLSHSLLSYRVTWSPRFPAPRTAILLCEYLHSKDLRGARVLDVGTGCTGILAIHAAASRASSVIGIDLDPRVIPPARSNVRRAGLKHRIKIKKGDVLTYHSRNKFTVILANLPFMPSQSNASQHDDGGPNGQRCILAFLDLLRRNLALGGTALFMAPDYLGITTRYGKPQSIRSVAASRGLCVAIALKHRMEVHPGSYTHEHIRWIARQYPEYRFGVTASGLLSHFLCIVSARHSTDHTDA